MLIQNLFQIQLNVRVTQCLYGRDSSDSWEFLFIVTLVLKYVPSILTKRKLNDFFKEQTNKSAKNQKNNVHV